jgi:phenylalanine-4-hydroxylase
MPRLYMAPVDLRRWRMARQLGNPKKWDQASTAHYFGVHERTWRRYERGETNIPQWLIRRVCQMRLTRAQKEYLAGLELDQTPEPPLPAGKRRT